MKYKHIILLLVFSWYTSKSFAQSNTLSVDTLAHRYSRALAQKLTLDTSQQRRIETAYKFRYNEIRLTATVTDTVVRKESLRKAQKKYDKVIKEILTPVQFKEYERINKQRKETIRQRAGAKGANVVEL